MEVKKVAQIDLFIVLSGSEKIIINYKDYFSVLLYFKNAYN